MGQARERQKSHERNIKIVLDSEDKFNKATLFEDFVYHADMNLHSLKGYQHLMDLIFVRSKHLHKPLVDSIRNNNSYISFVLLKAFWENTAMLGYVFVTAKNLMKNKDYTGLLDLAIKNALGGRGFVTDDMLSRSGATREELTQTNLITWMKKVDDNFDRDVAKEKGFSHFEGLYNEFVAECGHSTFLGLSICEERQIDGSVSIDETKTSQHDDDKMSFNHLALADNYFFHYWDKHEKELANWLIDLNK